MEIIGHILKKKTKTECEVRNIKIYVLKPGMVADTYNFNNLGAETGGLLLIGD